MAIEEAMSKLDKASENLANIGNLTDCIKSNKEKLKRLITEVVQYYSYIVNNTEKDSTDSVVAYATVYTISGKNPSLEKIIETILSVEKKENNNISKPNIKAIMPEKKITKNPIEVNPSALSNKIIDTINQVNKLHGYDAEILGELEWKLKQFKILLISQENNYGKDVYKNLLNDINLSLRKIESRNRIIRANPNQSYSNHGLTILSLLISLTGISSIIILILGIFFTN